MTQTTTTLMNITKGELVNYQGQECVILKTVDLTKVLVRNISAKNTEVVDIKHLFPWTVRQSTSDEQIKNDIDLVGVSEDDWEEARRRLEIIAPLLIRQARGTAIAKSISKQTEVGQATLYRWRDLYLNSGLLSSLLPTKRGGGQGRGRISEEVEAIIKDVLDNYHFTDQKPSIESTLEKIQTRCVNAQLPKPHWQTVKNRINWRPEREAFEGRHGKRAARQLFDPIEGTVPNALWPLALTQIDHTPLPVMVVHEITRRSIGRPYVTFNIA